MRSGAFFADVALEEGHHFAAVAVAAGLVGVSPLRPATDVEVVALAVAVDDARDTAVLVVRCHRPAPWSRRYPVAVLIQPAPEGTSANARRVQASHPEGGP